MSYASERARLNLRVGYPSANSRCPVPTVSRNTNKCNSSTRPSASIARTSVPLPLNVQAALRAVLELTDRLVRVRTQAARIVPFHIRRSGPDHVLWRLVHEWCSRVGPQRRFWRTMLGRTSRTCGVPEAVPCSCPRSRRSPSASSDRTPKSNVHVGVSITPFSVVNS